jgi:CRP-like cAMP-binding protein
MASLEQEVDLLRRIPLFANVEPAKLKLMAFTSQRVTYEAGQELFHQGDAGDAAYVIIGGGADVLVDTPGGEIKVAHMDKNAFVGEIAILCDVPRTATIKASDRLETLKIMKETFLRLLMDNPEMGVEVMRVLADRLSNTTDELTAAKAKIKELGG